ncbi:MAG: LytTR family DNA-binding domain-containing protein [Cytophagales bacterium]|nr:LytTR family DNA-binding domain-containing protein [Cytophagales bacterium]
MKTKCLIVDDEPLAVKVIKSHAEKIPSLEVVGTCSNALLAFDQLLRHDIDLVFLDVEMPEITGIDLLKSLKKAPAIIFTTAYRDFALEAYELDAVDYLLKPIAFERFFKSISKYYQWKGKGHLEVRGKVQSVLVEDPFIYVHSDRKIVKILLGDILFIESLKDYVKIHLKDEMIITKEKISSLEEKLPSSQFVRTHRSFIVAMKSIKAFTAETIEIRNYEIPIGRTYKNLVLSFLGYQK